MTDVQAAPVPRHACSPFSLCPLKKWEHSMPRLAPRPSVSADIRGTSDAQNRTKIEIGELKGKLNENRGRPLPVVLNVVVELVRELTEADGVAIAFRDAWGIVCRASVGEAPPVGSRLQSDSSLTRQCFESGQVMVCEDTDEDSRVGLVAKSWRLRSAVIVPVTARGSVLGVLEVLSSRACAFIAAATAALQQSVCLLLPLLYCEEPPQR